MNSLRARVLIQVTQRPNCDWRGRLASLHTRSCCWTKDGAFLFKGSNINENITNCARYSTFLSRRETFSSNLSCNAVFRNGAKLTTFLHGQDLNFKQSSYLHSFTTLNSFYRGKNRQTRRDSSKSFKGKSGAYSSRFTRYKNAGLDSGYDKYRETETRNDGEKQFLPYRLQKGRTDYTNFQEV